MQVSELFHSLGCGFQNTQEIHLRSSALVSGASLERGSFLRVPSTRRFKNFVVFRLSAFKHPSSLLTFSDVSHTNSSMFSNFYENASYLQTHDESLELENEKRVSYILRLDTSKEPQSSFSDPSGALLLAIIGEEGKTLLTRIDVLKDVVTDDEVTDDESAGSLSYLYGKSARFQQGSSDTVKIKGPDIGEISAVWVAPEKGTWRLDSLQILVSKPLQQSDQRTPEHNLLNQTNFTQISNQTSNSSTSNSSLTTSPAPLLNTNPSHAKNDHLNEEDGNCDYDEYDDEDDNIGVFSESTDYIFKIFKPEIFGESMEKQALELKPKSVNKSRSSAFLPVSIPATNNPLDPVDLEKLRKQSMQEYESFKTFLILSTSALVGIGSLSAYMLAGPDLAQAYALGGSFAVAYICYLQSVVDEIPGPKNSTEENSDGDLEEKNKTGLTSPKFQKLVFTLIALGLFFQAMVLKSEGYSISAPQLLAGFLGFVTHKVPLFWGAMNPNYSNSFGKK